MSDYVIATSQPFERHEISIPGDALWPEPFAQYTRPVVEKPAGTIHDWEFFWGVSGQMGVPLTFKFWNYGLNFSDIPLGMPLSITDKPDPEDLSRFLASESAVSFDELLANPGGVRPDLEPSTVQAAPGDGGRLELCPPDVASELAGIAGDGGDEGFAYRLTSRRILHAINGAYRESKSARRLYPVNYAYMNPEDMARDGIEEGDKVTIASEFGAVETLAKPEDRLRSGVVSMSHMFGPLVGSGNLEADGGANVGQLTSLTEKLEPINFMPRFSAIPVNVRVADRC